MKPILLIAALASLPALSASAQEVLGLPAYPGAESVPYQGSMRANDVPLDAVVVMTDDEIHRVMQHYRTALEQRGVKVVEHMFGPGSGYVGYFDVESGTMRMATSVSRHDGGTMIIFSSMNPLPLLQQAAQVPSDLPSLPGAVNVVTTESGEGSSRHRTIRYEVPAAKLEEVRDRLAQDARKKGWAVKPVEQKLAGLGLELSRGAERCMINITAMPAEEGGMAWTSVTMVLFNRGNR